MLVPLVPFPQILNRQEVAPLSESDRVLRTNPPFSALADSRRLSGSLKGQVLPEPSEETLKAQSSKPRG